ncbi:MAG: chromate resistance protein [Sneathiellales bacterium]|nr:chromate resistance protein [Sneathiellales bacterium]
MTQFYSYSPDYLWSLIGTPSSPTLIDVRIDEDFDQDPRLLPAAVRLSHMQMEHWTLAPSEKQVLVYCEKGLKLSEGGAAWLRLSGIKAGILQGGFQNWRACGFSLVPAAEIPERFESGTRWVLPQRGGVGHIACAWLVRRFIDEDAVFLFVGEEQTDAVAERYQAGSFDQKRLDGGVEATTGRFSALMATFKLQTSALQKLAGIIDAIERAEPQQVPEAIGFCALLEGLSHMCHDDLKQLEAQMPFYDALYHWAQEQEDE